MVSVSASEPGGCEFYPGLCSYSVFAILCNEFAMQACGKLAASSSYGDFEACVNLLQACFTLAHFSDKFAESLQTCSASLLQICCKLKLLSGSDSGGDTLVYKSLAQFLRCEKFAVNMDKMVRNLLN
ncbi:hypothetical protein AVEN_193031-1 [Araneus ventricosus]|uniref:Uncharacterized protein n=1 Tax=Araneus ventricosus TaxID=182803 RepID=A0A4Y2Q9I1_ARAVE|nr:hypothetical protein AVEN_193031-1 [Araneus ventricosus]